MSSKTYGDYCFLCCEFHFLIYFFYFFSNKFLSFYSLIKCQNIVGKTCDNQISPNDNYSILQAKLYACKCVGGCVCEYVCMYMCIYLCIIIKTCGKISSTDTSSKQLYMTFGYITIDETKQKKIHSNDGCKNDCIEILATVALKIN